MEEQVESSVKVLEHIRVSPPSGFLPPQPSLDLTYFDLIWLPFPPVQRLFFYSYRQTTTHFLNTTLPNIKQSLSLTLQHFYPLAGTLTWPLDSNKPQIRCSEDNSGVVLTVAESNLDCNNLVGNHARDVNQFFPLAPQLTRENTELDDQGQVPVMALQVTLFPDTGICIGISTLHVIGDGKTTINFMKSWASVCRSELGDTSCLVPESVPSYDRSLINDPYNIETTYLKDITDLFNVTQECFYRSITPRFETGKVRATFVLGKDEIQKLKKFVLHQLDEKYNKDGMTRPPLRLSTFALTTAYVWACLVKVLASNLQGDGSTEIEHLGFTVECRERLKPPLPMAYFGNCLVGCFVDVKRNDMIGKDGLANAAEALANSVQTLMSEGVLVGGENLLKRLKALFLKQRFLSIAGSPKLGAYDTDFGWGRPKKVEVVSIDTSTGAGAMSLSESRDGDGGLEVGLVLKKQQMEAFTSLFTNTLSVLS